MTKIRCSSTPRYTPWRSHAPTSSPAAAMRASTLLPTSPRSYRIDTGGLSLAVHEWGGDGHPVLLAHPTGFHGLTWAPVAARLVEAGRRVWSFDYRGHGDSDESPDGYRWA